MEEEQQLQDEYLVSNAHADQPFIPCTAYIIPTVCEPLHWFSNNAHVATVMYIHRLYHMQVITFDISYKITIALWCGIVIYQNTSSIQITVICMVSEGGNPH